VQLEIDVRDRKVVIFGGHPAASRVVKRFAVAGARTTAVVDGRMPLPADRLPSVRYAVRPEDDSLPDWMNLLGPAWLVVMVGLDGVTEQHIRTLCAHLRIVVACEPPADGHGVVTLVGGGPGVSRLLTLAARDALREADVVFYDRLAPTAELQELAPAAELVDVGKRPHHHLVPQAAIEEQMIARARRGASVVRLKGGDPFVFGRGGEEVVACAEAGVPVLVVPGVTSSIAAPALAGIPVTHRGVAHEFTVVSGHVPPDSPESLVDWPALARLRGTLVVLMGLKNLPKIAARLVAEGRAPHTPAAVVQEGSTQAQRVLRSTLGEVAAAAAEAGIKPPAVVVIGNVVSVLGISS